MSINSKDIRYFKERGIPHQYIDLSVKGMSKGELQSVINVVGRVPIDRSGKEFKKRGLAGISFLPEQVLLEFPLLMETPVVREGKRATIGYCPEVWSLWRE